MEAPPAVNLPTIAAAPAFGLVTVALLMLGAAMHSQRRAPQPTHRIVIALMFCALSVNALVAGLAFLGYVQSQDVITFWAALSRTVGIVCGLYIAYHWWRSD